MKIFNDNFYFDICLSDKVNRVIGVHANSLAYRNKHKSQKCYKCHKYGHIADNCDSVCGFCGLFHPDSMCLRKLIDLLAKLCEDLSGEYRRDINKLNKLLEIKNNEEIQIVQHSSSYDKLSPMVVNNIFIERTQKQIKNKDIKQELEGFATEEFKKFQLYCTVNNIEIPQFNEEQVLNSITDNLSSNYWLFTRYPSQQEISEEYDKLYKEWTSKIETLVKNYNVQFKAAFIPCTSGNHQFSIIDCCNKRETKQKQIKVNHMYEHYNHNQFRYVNVNKSKRNKALNKLNKMIDVYALIKDYTKYENEINQLQRKVEQLKKQQSLELQKIDEYKSAYDKLYENYHIKRDDLRSKLISYGNGVRNNCIERANNIMDKYENKINKVNALKEQAYQQREMILNKRNDEIIEHYNNQINKLTKSINDNKQKESKLFGKRNKNVQSKAAYNKFIQNKNEITNKLHYYQEKLNEKLVKNENKKNKFISEREGKNHNRNNEKFARKTDYYQDENEYPSNESDNNSHYSVDPHDYYD
jgi:hypothetical protein